MIGLEGLAVEAARSIAAIFFQTGWEGVGRFGKILDKKTQQMIFQASQQYIQNYTERHGILKVLGMREPVALESVYTAVQFLDKWDIRRFESIETLEKAYRETRSFQPKNCIKRDGLKVADEKQYLMVLGGPGVGKSTFLRKMGLEALKGKQGRWLHECIPVFIELKSFTSSEIDLEQAIAQEFRICGFPYPQESTVELLEEGKLLILLDGLDEVPAKIMNQAIGKIEDFVDLYAKNRFITSCRIAAYRHNFRRFTDVAMAEFDNAQIKQFIYNWFQSEEDRKVETAQKCWEILQKAEYAAAKELAHTPLLLTLLCLVYDHSQTFPNNRSVLYRKALRVLLEEWAAEKRILRDEIYKGLRTELQEILLAEIAYTGFAIDQLFFSQPELVSQIKIFLALARDRALELASTLSPNLTRALELTRVLDLARALNPNLNRTLNSTRTPSRPSTPTRAFARALTHALAQELESIKVFKDLNFTVLMARLEVLNAKAPDINQSYKAHQGFNNRVSQIWLKALKLNPELVCLSAQESQDLDNYLYANLLIAQCKQAAVRVSAKTWEAIEARMLLMPRDLKSDCN